MISLNNMRASFDSVNAYLKKFIPDILTHDGHNTPTVGGEELVWPLIKRDNLEDEKSDKSIKDEILVYPFINPSSCLLPDDPLCLGGAGDRVPAAAGQSVTQ